MKHLLEIDFRVNFDMNGFQKLDQAANLGGHYLQS